MKKLLAYTALSLGVSVICAPGGYAMDEVEMVNRPVNSRGLTGLIITTSPFVLPAGTVEAGAGILTEDSTTPKFTVSEYTALVAAGLGKNMELALRGSYFRNEDNNTGAKTRGPGDTEIALKWNFLPPKEDSARPLAALFVTGIIPTGDAEKGMSLVNNWGARIGFSGGAEISWDEHILGFYADIQLVLQDLSNQAYRDAYYTADAGILFPISKYRNLQLILEYTIVEGRDASMADGGDYTAFTPGLRLVSTRFNLTFGSELINKQEKGYDNSSRLIGILSMKF